MSNPDTCDGHFFTLKGVRYYRCYQDGRCSEVTDEFSKTKVIRCPLCNKFILGQDLGPGNTEEVVHTFVTFPDGFNRFEMKLSMVLALLLFLSTGCRPVTPPVNPPQPPVEPWPSDTEERLDINEKLLKIHNDNRTSLLVSNLELTRAAQRHADWMAFSRRMSHTGKGGSSPGGRIKAEGYAWTTYGENIAYGQSTPEDVMRVWMSSSGHRRNIKNTAYNDVGFGHTKASSGQIYWCVVFGSRAFGNADKWDESQATPEFEE